jgi:type I restriction enzyme R subunit
LGDHGAAGNPPNGKGHRTWYLWEQVWQRDSWLEIIGRYLVTKRDSKKQISSAYSSPVTTNWTPHVNWSKL